MLKGGPDDEISAGTGGKLAGPIAKQVLDYLFAHPTAAGGVTMRVTSDERRTSRR